MLTISRRSDCSWRPPAGRAPAAAEKAAAAETHAGPSELAHADKSAACANPRGAGSMEDGAAAEIKHARENTTATAAILVCVNPHTFNVRKAKQPRGGSDSEFESAWQ